ncbi:MAG: ubiquinol-cytochrome c reductase iron-sulfur subunit [Gammaproteobacteria bacterium]
MSKEQRSVDQKRRRFLKSTTALLSGVGVVAASVPFVASWLPSAQAQAAGAPREVDISKLAPGELITVEWRGKPVWIIMRTPQMLQDLTKNESHLRDPDSVASIQPDYVDKRNRALKPNILVLIGICTHLGCAPSYEPEIGALGPAWRGGFFCPCHGSSFDLAGRVYTGVPAPINLEVPPYYYASDNVIIVGEDPPVQPA